MRVDSVYSKILSDLDFAEANLPVVQPGSGASTYRATKAAAIALKMRIKLHKGDWAGVIAEGNKLVPAAAPFVSPVGGWKLTATPDGAFASNTSSENVFSVKNDATDAPSTNGALAAMYGSATLKGRGLVAISPDNAGCLSYDKRRTTLTVAGANNAGNQSYFITKYRDYLTNGDFAPQIRYAEVLLTLAEAEARNAAGVSTRALDLLNAVRDRSLATPASQSYTAATFATKNALIAAILLERRIEFLGEGKRWSDISRLAKDPDFTINGIPAKAVNGNGGASGFATYNCGAGYTAGQAAIPYSDYRFVWPIPQSEIDANPVIKQNPNY
jgi:hypothetical protein